MRERHWDTLKADTEIDLRPDGKLSLTRALELGVMECKDRVVKVFDIATKEFAIEKTLDKMEKEWSDVELQVRIHFRL